MELQNIQLESPKPSEALAQTWDKLIEWFNQCILLIPNLILAAITVYGFAKLANWAGKLAESGLERFTKHQTLSRLVGNFAKSLVLGLGLFMALELVGLDKAVTSLLAGAGVVGLALAFAFQEIAGNFMSGILLAVRRPFEVGDVLESNEFFGTVIDLNLGSTSIRTPEGQTVLIPNSKVVQNPMKNFSKGERRVEVACGISYADELSEVEELVCRTISGLGCRLPHREVTFYYQEFGDSSINFVAQFWIDYRSQKDFLSARSQAIVAIKAAFDKNEVTIPFPIRTLDFDPVGGLHLGDVLKAQVERVSQVVPASFKN